MTIDKNKILDRMDAENDVSANNMIGYQPISRADLPYQGKYYPDGWQFSIKAASSKEIIHFSSINEDDKYSLLLGMNQIIRSCVKIVDKSTKTTKNINTKNVFDHDRMFFVLAIHSISRDSTTSGLSVDYQCSNCGKFTEMYLGYKNLSYTEESDLMLKYFNEDTKMIEVTTKTGKTINFAPPTIYDGERMKEFSIDIRTKKDMTDYQNVFLVDILPKIINVSNKSIKDLHLDFISYDEKMVSLVIELCTNHISWSQKQDFTAVCPKCDVEGATPMNFRKGSIKNLFVVPNIIGELLG